MNGGRVGRLLKLQTRLDKLPLLLLVLVGLGLRLYKLEQESLRGDELGQVLIAKNSWWQGVLLSVQHKGNTPLDYVVTHFALYIGQSEGVLRLPAVTWGVLSIIIIYRLGREMFDIPTGYLAAFLLTIMPLHVNYSRDVRFYSLATLLMLLSTYTLWQAIHGNTRWSWIRYGVVHSLALYTHYYFLVVTLIQALWLYWCVYTKRDRRSTFRHFVVVAGFTLLIFAPWLYYDIQYEQLYRQGLLNAGYAFRFPPLVRLLNGPYFFEDEFSFAKPSTWWTVFAWGTMLAGGLVIPRRWRFGSHYTPLTLLFLYLVGGVSSVLLIDHLVSYRFMSRQLLFYTPAMLLITSVAYLDVFRLAWAKLTKSLRTEKADRLAILVVMLFSLWGLWQPLTDVYSRRKQDWRGTARYLVQHVRPGDVVLTPRESFVEFYVPELSWQVRTLTDEVSDLLETSESHERIWVLATSHFLRESFPNVHRWIQQKRPIDVSLDPGIRLYIWSATTSSSELLAELLHGRAYTSATLRFSNLLTRAIDEGYIQESMNMAIQILIDERVELADRIAIAIETGRALLDNGECDKAADILRRAIALDPTNADLWVALGSVYSHQGREDEAVSAYRRALEYDPKHYPANHLLATKLYHQGEWRAVINLEERAVRSASRSNQRIASLIKMADAYSRLGNNPKACKVLRQAYTVEETQKVLTYMAKLGCTE